MGLEINRIPARLNIETTHSNLSIQNRKAKLELSHKEAKVDVRTELPRVVIDQYECFATSGLMGPIDLTRQEGQRGIQQALTYASKVAGDGDSIAAIENPDPIPGIVERDAFPEHEFGLDYMPKARPKITVTGGVQINAERNAEGANNGVQGTYTPAAISFNYTPAQVRISMAQYPSISMRYTGSRFDKFV
ncbi:MAG: hypothetical protein GX279_05755 [Clostridiaceae bacterium]|nr:hypothetical protein [Clostridiaceae bacterium]